MTLSEIELIYQQIIDFTQDGILFADKDGNIQLWNSGAETIFGYRSEEAIGTSLDLIIPERLRQRHWKGYQKVMGTGKTRYGTELLKVPALRKDGKHISLEFSIVLIRDNQDRILGSAAIMRDVTERWQHEKELKERLNFLEDQVKL